MPAKYVPNRSFARQQDAESLTRQGLALVADEVAKRARESAPGGFMGFKKSIRAGSSGGDAGVFAGPGWHLVEFGSVYSSPRAVFRRACERLGLKIRSTRGGA